MEVAIIIIESLVIIIGLIHILKDLSFHKTNTLFILDSVISNTKLLKEITNQNLAFEIERKMRRILLFVFDKDLQTQSLFWFRENGNSIDKSHIKKALNKGCFRNQQKKMAKEIISKSYKNDIIY